MNYLVASSHSPEHDKAIRWDSFGFDWGVTAPVMSQRDKEAIELSQFISPFK
jgi:dTDP-4-dehydrorhamnose 3,5-epimerase-like enzyme